MNHIASVKISQCGQDALGLYRGREMRSTREKMTQVCTDQLRFFFVCRTGIELQVVDDVTVRKIW